MRLVSHWINPSLTTHCAKWPVVQKGPWYKVWPGTTTSFISEINWRKGKGIKEEKKEQIIRETRCAFRWTFNVHIRMYTPNDGSLLQKLPGDIRYLLNDYMRITRTSLLKLPQEPVVLIGNISVVSNLYPLRIDFFVLFTSWLCRLKFWGCHCGVMD